MLVTFLFFVLHLCNFYHLVFSNYITNYKLYFNCDCCCGDIDFHLYSQIKFKNQFCDLKKTSVKVFRVPLSLCVTISCKQIS